MFNFLASTIIETMPVFDNPYNLNFIGNFIRWLVESLPNMGLGVIVFTIILKLITLPADIWSRVSMKKNNLKMERMRPQLEKLQRQYANNKEQYNLKIQSLYKKEGYSAFSTCLPTILTLVIFFIVINQFSNYSNYANLQLISGMANSYNTAVDTYNETYDSDLVLKVGNEYYINQDKIITEQIISDAGVSKTVDETTGFNNYLTVDINKFATYVKGLNEQGYEGVTVGKEIVASGSTYVFSRENYSADATDEFINQTVTNKVFSDICQEKILEVKTVARQASADFYRANVPSFLWVKNIWVEDLPWKHPVKNTFSEYNFTIRQGCKAVNAGINMEDSSYAELTFALQDEKTQPNGYLILVILSIGIMFLSTIISNRTQKAQLELQSVDGAAASTNKMMMWMMPVMFGIFAFIYTASFSLYMVVSSVLSTLGTILINKLVEIRFAKKLAEEESQKDKRFRKSNSQVNNEKK